MSWQRRRPGKEEELAKKKSWQRRRSGKEEEFTKKVSLPT